MKNKKKIKKKP